MLKREQHTDTTDIHVVIVEIIIQFQVNVMQVILMLEIIHMVIPVEEVVG